MKIAVLADIHGNMPALEATIADVETQAVDEVLVGGDLVGRGPEGSRVTRRIAELGWPCVRGNHEDYLLAFRRREVPAEWLDSDDWAASRWMAAELEECDVTYIDSLPFSLRSRRAPDLRLVHGSPRSHSEGLGAWSSDADLAGQLGRVCEPLLVCGHTHRPMVRRLDAGLVVNAGSVGLPFNRDRRAQYVVLQQRDGEWDVELRKVPYAGDAVLAIYESSGFLREGGVTAQLLRLELKHAAPFLVPFLKWAEACRVAPRAAQLQSFLEFYDSDEPIHRFYDRLARL